MPEGTILTARCNGIESIPLFPSQFYTNLAGDLTQHFSSCSLAPLSDSVVGSDHECSENFTFLGREIVRTVAHINSIERLLNPERKGTNENRLGKHGDMKLENENGIVKAEAFPTIECKFIILMPWLVQSIWSDVGLTCVYKDENSRSYTIRHLRMTWLWQCYATQGVKLCWWFAHINM